MKKIILLALAGVAMVGLGGCNVSDITGGESTVQVYTDNLYKGYRVSGYDSTIGKDTDLCFDGNNYVYGRGAEYFDGTYYTSGGDIVFRDATDGGSYRLITGGEIVKGYIYDFSGISNTIQVETIVSISSVNDCKGMGATRRTASSLGLAGSIKH